MQRYVKHATLINNCYPDKDGESKPRSSELSYLVFYASSRPEKLTKVGLFLEKKVERDVSRSRMQNNQVSLSILKALIESCHRDLNLFSKYVVKIVSMVLDSKDIELIDRACDLFIVYSSYNDGSDLGLDTELTKDYKSLLLKLSKLCHYDNKDETLKLQMEYNGQRALQAAITSTAMQSSDAKFQLDIILTPLIKTLAASINPPNALVLSAEGSDINQSALGFDTLNNQTVVIMSAKSTHLLFSRANAASIKASLAPIFAYLDKHGKWWPSKFAISIMILVLESLQSQYRYLLVSEILQQIELAETQENQEKHASLVCALNAILNANTPLVGISVLEVLNSLFNHLIHTLEGGQQQLLLASVEPTEAQLDYTIQQGLLNSIGGLASQTYYVNQLNDITGYMISKLCTTQETEGFPLKQYRKVVLKCLEAISDAAAAADRDESASEEDGLNLTKFGTATLETWAPALSLLSDQDPETRVDFASTIVHHLKVTSTEEASIEPFDNHALDHQGDLQFVNQLHQKIIEWIQSPELNVYEVESIYRLLSSLVGKFGTDETIKLIPLVFKIQSLVKENKIRHTGRQRAVAALVIEWLLFVAEYYSSIPLGEYADEIKQARLGHREYSPMFVSSRSKSLTSSFELLEPDNTNPVDKYADKRAVVSILIREGTLSNEEEEEDVTELENKLMAEWGSEDYEKQDRTFRIRTSRNLNDLKAKLVMPWTTSPDLPVKFYRMRNEIGKKPISTTVKVETLRDALASTQIVHELTGIELLTENCLSKRPNNTVSDMSALLSSLSLTNDAPKRISDFKLGQNKTQVRDKSIVKRLTDYF
ncbi:hypothetical protein K501DRAFT_269817 [Backusella circina FSU 941]|nr:hypothetical protein K501DRAFT_269817 [Backusella circina FSU 941]